MKNKKQANVKGEYRPKNPTYRDLLGIDREDNYLIDDPSEVDSHLDYRPEGAELLPTIDPSEDEFDKNLADEPSEVDSHLDYRPEGAELLPVIDSSDDFTLPPIEDEGLGNQSKSNRLVELMELDDQDLEGLELDGKLQI